MDALGFGMWHREVCWMRTSRHVRGVLFLDYVRMVRGRRLVDAHGHLLAEDHALLQQRIELDAWYPMESFERLGRVILDELVGRERDAVRLWGRAQVTSILQFTPELLAPGDPKETIARFGGFFGTLFDFPAIELESLTHRQARIRIDYGMEPLAEEAACWQSQGFFEALTQESGGREVRGELRSGLEGLVRAPSLLELRWENPVPELAASAAALPRVLLVDDEPLVLSALERVMRRWARVTCAASAGVALEHLEAEPFDVVISDYAMGKTDGLTLLATVADRWPATARVLHTARAPAGAGPALAKGVLHAVAEKPVEPTALRRVIAEAQKRAAGDPSGSGGG